MKQFTFGILLAGFVSVSAYAAPTSNPFSAVRAQNQKGAKEAALAELYKIQDAKITGPDREWKYYEMGRLSFELGRHETAVGYMQASEKEGQALKAYRHHLIGKVYQQDRDFKKARHHFQMAMNQKPPRNLSYEIRYSVAQMDMAQGRWRSAYRGLKYLYRKWRGSLEQADAIYDLIGVELKLKRKWRACRWARKMYSRFPTYDKVTDWGVDLHKVEYNKKVLGCLASPSDQKGRIKRFQWAGRSDRAEKEILELQKRTTENTKYSVDSILANFYVREGYVDKALKILLVHYKKQQKNFSYLMLLANAAAKAGEYQAAVGSYYSAYKLKPRGRLGRKALFHAAFLSYQFQDYDGAVRKFTEFTKKYPRSGLSRESQWHISWVKYLKGDYEGAALSFQSILAKKKRRPRRWRQMDKEKIQYWLAMSYLRADHLDRAKEIFLQVAEDRLLGYYSLAAQYRLLSLPGVKMSDVLKLQGVVARGLASQDELREEELEPELKNELGTTQPGGSNKKVAEEDETEETIEQEIDEEGSEERLATREDQEDEALGEDEVGFDLEIPWLNSQGERQTSTLASLKGEGLKKRLARAYGFIALGNFEQANWELYEIERRTKSTKYLKILMHAYQEVEAYNRSAYVGAIQFAKNRKQNGIKGVRYLWEYAYPQAFKKEVEGYSKSSQILPELAWSIMRAETMFRATAVSPVGARGLMQIMPHTGERIAGLLGERRFDAIMLSDPDMNIRFGTRYLQRLSKKFESQIPLVAAGYNAGPHRVEGWLRRFGDRDMDEFIEHIPFIETRNYTKKVVRHFGIYQTLYNDKNLTMAWLSQPVPIKREGPPPTREYWGEI